VCGFREYKLELEQMMARVESQPTLFQKQSQVINIERSLRQI
jgi:hypothetical protein